MVLPLDEVNKIDVPASKPGNIIDKYVKIQNINNATNECRKEIVTLFQRSRLLDSGMIDDIIVKWLSVTK